MNLEKLYEMQQELDDYILKNNNVNMNKEERLDNTILALLVEVGELANTTRCFKYWSDKGMMDKEVVLDELADVLHFYLSIGNQINEVFFDNEIYFPPAHHRVWFPNENEELSSDFIVLYAWAGELADEAGINDVDLGGLYQAIGESIFRIKDTIGFTDKEVERAYLKKHKENYRRQEEGY